MPVWADHGGFTNLSPVVGIVGGGRVVVTGGEMTVKDAVAGAALLPVSHPFSSGTRCPGDRAGGWLARLPRPIALSGGGNPSQQAAGREVVGRRAPTGCPFVVMVLACGLRLSACRTCERGERGVRR